MAKPPASPMTIAQINALREALVENAIALIADADLLFVNGRPARAYSVAILATEEISKIPALIACLDQLDKGNQPDWDDIAEFLSSHYGKLMMNELYFTAQRSATGLDATGSKQWQEAVKAAKDRNTRKQRGFYVTIDAGVITTPAAAVDKEHAKFALGLARITFNMMELVNRAFTLRQHNPKAPVAINFRYSLMDDPLVDNSQISRRV
jgi:AbiV family abortive infection protein